jgi:hypothetical protein
MVCARAHERLILTRREIGELQGTLWNRLVETINSVVAPLTAEAR